MIKASEIVYLSAVADGEGVAAVLVPLIFICCQFSSFLGVVSSYSLPFFLSRLHFLWNLAKFR